LEQGADPNHPLPDTGEVPLHAPLCHEDRAGRNRVLRVLLAAGADPNRATRPGVATGSFMRDVFTRGETPLHRAAALGDMEAIQLLLDAGANPSALDARGESPLGWASWHRQSAAVLRLFDPKPPISPAFRGMGENLQGDP
jgi:ankyrin repeat protein